MKIIKVFIAMMLITQTHWAMALTESENKRKNLALQYLQAYVTLNYPQLSHYYSESSLFRDISADKSLKGTRDILTFLQKSTVGMKSYRFIPDQIYIGSSSVSLIGSYEIETEGTLYGKPNQTLHLTIPGITVLVVSTKNNIIKEHIDILDYTSMKDQLEKY